MIKKILAAMGGLMFVIQNLWAAETLSQANNPIANMKTLNFQNYYIPDITGLNQTGDTFWIRYAQPIDKFLIRASMPFTSYPISPTVKKKWYWGC